MTISLANSIPLLVSLRPGERLLADRPQAAMGIADARAEEQVEHAGQQRIADIAVLPRHCAGGDPAEEARAHAHVGAPSRLATIATPSTKS